MFFDDTSPYPEARHVVELQAQSRSADLSDEEEPTEDSLRFRARLEEELEALTEELDLTSAPNISPLEAQIIELKGQSDDSTDISVEEPPSEDSLRFRARLEEQLEALTKEWDLTDVGNNALDSILGDERHLNDPIAVSDAKSIDGSL